ncbi:MAG TPA: response regulator transcription factor [Bryobacteraceae bacterium]|nr:response regulator transcription factor [Bryobacteraceae bacterium]
MIRIAIIADTPIRARHLANLLAEDDRLDIVDTDANNMRRLDARVDVVVVATSSQAVDTSHYDLPVVLIGNGRPEFGHNIRGSLPASASASEISAAIEAAANQLTVLTQEQALRLMPANQGRTDEETFVEELTRRELQVLRMMADGSGNKEIALALGISEHTVKFHVAQVLAKLNAGSRTEAVSLGIRRGLIAI